ncbi:MAG: uracil-DNA glycosylase family protein [Eubacteriales bacterium]
MAEKKGVQKLKHPIAPFFSPQSKVIILGSFPSPKSRETGFYYGHPQNRFWKVMASLFSEKTPETIPRKESDARKARNRAVGRNKRM